jgi:murein L,D-transpeptidase YcbB/YkuD
MSMNRFNAFDGGMSGRRTARLRNVAHGVVGGSLIAFASFAGAQDVPTPAPVLAPSAATMIGQPLPRLSDAQARQLAKLIAQDEVRQGLRQGAPRDLSGMTGDALTRVALDHARAVHAGRLDTSDFDRDWGIRPQRFDPLPGFADAVERDRLSAWVASLPPPYAGYDALVAGLSRYRALAADGGWGTVAAAPELKFGRSGPAVAALRKRLAAEDTQVSATGDKFDADLLDGVRRAQRRYGLNPAGDVGAQTLAALNVPVTTRMRQIAANMERWRWLPAQLEQKRVQVNVAAAVLTVFDGDAPVMSMKAVTGRPGNETPMLVSSIHSVVLNPPWNVPSSIADKELWPKERANPGYLKRAGFRVIDTGNGGKRLQQSSEKSALGRYKFDFPNDFAVYLHDTPAQSGFSRFDRLASHGCVRLEKPEALAKLLMKTTPQWQPEAIDSTVAAGKTVRAQMAEPVAVYLMYWTAVASPAGQVGFRDDPYGWDGELASKVEARQAKQTLASL